VPTPSEWFCALLDTATEVYFRYSLGSANRGFAYISPSVEVLTGHAPADFYNDTGLVRSLSRSADYQLGLKTGWEKKTRERKRHAFLAGGLLGTAVWIVIVASAQSGQ
jgi:hypothetical protein